MNDWRDKAACRGQDTRIFFPGPSDNPASALHFCRRCPVKDACLQDAMDEEARGKYRHGVRGGLIAAARYDLAKHGGQFVPCVVCSTRFALEWLPGGSRFKVTCSEACRRVWHNETARRSRGAA